MAGKRKTPAIAAADRVDGLGNPIVDANLYYVQDDRTIVGNCVLWWRPEGAGYACDIDDAGIYTGDYVRGLRETDVAWPVAAVAASARRYVDIQILRRVADQLHAAKDRG